MNKLKYYATGCISLITYILIELNKTFKTVLVGFELQNILVVLQIALFVKFVIPF